ncbi:secretin N-terminal domain-containing protein [Enterocloster aldenensis]|uniref:secretin N-terminal domain-containing protein n=1 Tax=Enterocloster aldenensis TaxID=358742 RepID=UPI00338E2743
MAGAKGLSGLLILYENRTSLVYAVPALSSSGSSNGGSSGSGSSSSGSSSSGSSRNGIRIRSPSPHLLWQESCFCDMMK